MGSNRGLLVRIKYGFCVGGGQSWGSNRGHLVRITAGFCVGGGAVSQEVKPRSPRANRRWFLFRKFATI